MNDLEKRFDTAMRSVYDRASTECDYRPTYFLKMVDDRGGVSAAKALLAGKPSEGFGKLWELGRLDLSVEAVVLDERWRDLFADAELETARKRLSQAGYKPE